MARIDDDCRFGILIYDDENLGAWMKAGRDVVCVVSVCVLHVAVRAARLNEVRRRAR